MFQYEAVPPKSIVFLELVTALKLSIDQCASLLYDKVILRSTIAQFAVHNFQITLPCNKHVIKLKLNFSVCTVSNGSSFYSLFYSMHPMRFGHIRH